MHIPAGKPGYKFVALLAEGVDRNWISCRLWQNTRMSPSSRRAWIEILLCSLCPVPGASPSSRRAWIEIILRAKEGVQGQSPSSRRAWIEITNVNYVKTGCIVAILAEGVDRNSPLPTFTAPSVRRPPRGGRG